MPLESAMPRRCDEQERVHNRMQFEADAVPLMAELFPAAYRLAGNRQDAEDLVQETFAKAFLKFHQYRSGTNLRAWLRRIMINTFYSQCRRRRAQPAELLAADVEREGDVCRSDISRIRSAEEEAIENLAGSRAMRALAELPGCFKATVYLADVLGYQLKEVAEITDTPLGTTRSRIHRGRRLLRLRLVPRGPSLPTLGEAPAP